MIVRFAGVVVVGRNGCAPHGVCMNQEHVQWMYIKAKLCACRLRVELSA